MRKERMENLTTTGKIAGRRDRGQQRITLVKSSCHLLNITIFQFLRTVKYRVLWRPMVLKRLGTRKKEEYHNYCFNYHCFNYHNYHCFNYHCFNYHNYHCFNYHCFKYHNYHCCYCLF
ncbi:hypothetical protein HELRODRAFT_178895 [Helobdella robusta]|uniref:Uncharacterized protein n=1 Tax=Helobdella robusta TaxID=6412 RepID=T1FDV4_HELRO|nr:hypothetical protein HELRODRAFT_178895 [Helobdella robusta]ESN95975.1 hypothetical protein HELRODRAFT_178895 [Helobdella robusta]